MKRICFFTVVLFLCFHSKGQENNQLNEMIISSVNSYISWKNDLRKNLGWQHSSNYYICQDGFPRNFPFDSLQNVIYGSLENIEGLSSTYKKKLNKGIGFLFVGIEITDNRLFIAVSGRNVKRTKKNNVNIALVDWGHYFYEYSCEKQKWELKETKYGGV